MASQLHARRKHGDEEARPLTQTRSNSGGEMLSAMKESKYKEGRKEIRAALMSVSGFLMVGVCLGFFLLRTQHRRVVLHVMKNPFAHGGAVLQGRAGFQHHFYSGPPRYVTVVLPSVVNPWLRPKRLRTIQETWGPYARSIFVVHNITEFSQAETHKAIISETSEPGDPYSYPQALLVPPEIQENDGIPRLMHVIRTVHERIDPDYAYFVNDHTYVLPEHLCNYLEGMDPLEDLYAGHALKSDEHVFNSGAAGYILSRSTMRKLLRKWVDRDPNCVIKKEGDAKQKWLQGNPGLLTTICLRNALNITAIDTREKGKYHRFHAFPLTRSVSGNVDQWYRNKHSVEMAQKIGADESYATLLKGDNCCAKTTVSFHYVEAAEAKALFATRGRLLHNPHMSDKELKYFMIAEWPKNKKEIGPYSHGLPEANEEEEWTALLRTLRKMTTRETQRDC